jgi:arginyl-tRNA synthetase
MINIWGSDHHGYVARVKASLAAMGYNPNKLEVLLLQMVNLLRNGEVVKMSKRTGKTITLNELIEEVGTDAARYFFIMRSLDSQLDFDLDWQNLIAMKTLCIISSMPMLVFTVFMVKLRMQRFPMDIGVPLNGIHYRKR